MGHIFVNTLKPEQNGRHLAEEYFKCIFCIFNENVCISAERSPKFDSKDANDNKWSLFHVMVSCRTGAKPLPESLMIMFFCDIVHTRPWWVNTWTKWPPFRRRFIQMHFLRMKSFVSRLIISLKFVFKGPIGNISALVYIKAWCRIGDKPLSTPMPIRFTDAYMRL